MSDPRVRLWDERYAREDYLFGEAPNVVLERQRERLQPGWRALAVADGEGRNGVWFAERALEVLSVGTSIAQGKACRLAGKRGSDDVRACGPCRLDLAHRGDWESLELEAYDAAIEEGAAHAGSRR